MRRSDRDSVYMREAFGRILLAGIAFGALALSPAVAGEIEAKSRIDAVTVYPDGAIVRREVDVDLPQGSTLLVFRGLPLSIDPASLRIEGQASGGLTLGAVETRRSPGDPSKANSAGEEQLKALRLEREKFTVEIETIEGRKAMIQRFAQAGPERQGQGDAGKGLDVEKWSAAWEQVGAALGKVNDELRRVRGQIRETDEKIRAIEAADGVMRRGAQPEREVIVSLEAGQALKGKLSLSYRVNGAVWRPVYDARLDTGDGGKPAQLVLTRRALVSQRTGEDWADVALTLSTVRASRGTAAPEVNPQRVAFYEPSPPVSMGLARTRAINEVSDAMKRKEDVERPVAATPAPVPMQALTVAQAGLDASGFQASYRMDGRLTVPRDGAEKSFAFQSRAIQPEIMVRAAPALDPTAYLEAVFLNSEDAPLLAGEVSLIRDGAFVGRGRLAFTAAGEKAQLGFGADDRVKVSRVPVRRRETEPALLGSTKSDTREFKTLVKNLHDFPIRAMIVDQTPFSELAAITVETLPNTTQPTEKTMQDKRGVIGWTYDLKPSEEKEIRFGYRVRWPSDRELVFEQAPNPR